MRRALFSAVILAAVVGTSGPVLAAERPAAAPKVVYVGDNGQKDLVVANLDGSRPRNITKTPALNEVMPALSADGTKIVFVREGAGIWVINTNGTGLVQITTNASDLEPAWFPDGSKIVFTRRQGDRDLWTMNADGSNPVKLLDNDVEDQTPDISPNGLRVAWSAAPVGLFVMNVDGSNLQYLASYFYCRKDQSWSPDNVHFAFTQCEFDGSSNIWVFDTEGFGSVQITPEAGTERQPSWSADGTTIFYTKVLSGTNTAVFAIDSDGTDERAVTATGGRLAESDPSVA